MSNNHGKKQAGRGGGHGHDSEEHAEPKPLPLMLLVILGTVGVVFAVLWVKFTIDWTRESVSEYIEDEDSVTCIQVITRARNPATNEERDFPTPCDVPDGWVKINP